MAATAYTVETAYGYLRTRDAQTADEYSRQGHRVTATTGEA